MWEVKVKFHSMSHKEGTNYITFTADDVEGRPVPFGDDYYKMTLSKYRPPKSQNANSYYWVLVNKLSDELSKEETTSVARVHNLNLRAMWNKILLRVDGTPKMEIIPNTEKAEQSVLDDMDNHLMPVPNHILENPIFTNSKGKEFRYYFVLKGVRHMDSKEMSMLINICIQNCQAVGIETLTPRELEQLEGYEKQINY